MSDSELEAIFEHWWNILSPDGVPDPVREYKGAVPGRNFKCDFCWPNQRVIVEIDGGTHLPGGGRHNTDPDRKKINLLTLHGWRVFRYSGSMLKNDPDSVIKEVAQAVLGLKERA